MKSKLILAFSLAFFALTSCARPITVSSSDTRDPEIVAIYELYRSNGGTMLYEDWLASIKGEKGDAGKSAYEIAVENGFRGTEAEWLASLSGNGIESIKKTGTNGNTDTYTIYFTDGSSTTFTIKNGETSKEIVSAYIDDDNHFIIVYSDGSTYNSGNIFRPSSLEDFYDYYPLDDGSYAIGVGKNKYLTEITLPTEHNGKPITQIAENGFVDSKANTIIVPEGIKYIDRYAFNGNSIMNIILPDSLDFCDSNFISNSRSSLSVNEYEGCYYLGTNSNPYYVYVDAKPELGGKIMIHPDCKIYRITHSKGETLEIREGTKGVGIYFVQNVTESLTLPHSIKYIDIKWNVATFKPNKIIYYGTEEDWAMVNKLGYDFSDVEVIFHPSEHSYSDIWSYDETHHWHATTCGHDEKKDYGEHVFNEWRVVKEPTELKEGLKERTCGTCGYTESVTLNKIDIYDYELLSNDTYQITLKGDIDREKLVGDYVVPETYNGKDVTVIAQNTFQNCVNITSIELPNTIVEIGISAFKGCTSITSFIIPSSVTTLGGWAFLDCTALESVLIPDSVINIGAGNFAQCGKLKALYLSKNISSIPHNNFYNSYPTILFGGTKEKWNQLEIEPNNFYSGVVFNAEVETISSINEGFESYVLVNNKDIHHYVYNGSKETISLNNDANHIYKSLGYKAFYGNANITSLTIPNTIESLASYSVSSLPNLTELIYQGTIEEWDKVNKAQAWNNDTTFEITYSPIVPHEHTYNNAWSNDETHHWHAATCEHHDQMIDYEEHVFGEWSILEQPTYTVKGMKVRTCNICSYEEYEEIPLLEEYLDYYLLPNNTYGVKVGHGQYLEHVVIPETHNGLPVTKILDGAFTDCLNLVSIDIPNTVEVIDANAFKGCANLKNIDIPSSVKTINDSAFYNCTSLEEIIIPEGVKELGSSIFGSCTSLTTVTFPLSVTSSGALFTNSNNIESFYYNGDIASWCSIEGAIVVPANNFYVKDSEGEIIHHEMNYSLIKDELVIPEGVTTIKPKRFFNFDISSVSFPETLVTIESQAFSGTNITSLSFPDSLKRIEHLAFENCKPTKVSLPDNIEYVASNLFEYVNIGTYDLYNQYNNGYYLGNDKNPYLVLLRYAGANHTTHANCRMVSDLYLYYMTYTLDITSNVKYIYISYNHNMLNDGSTYRPAYYHGTIDDLVYCTDLVPIYSDTKPTDTTHLYWHGILDYNSRRDNSCIWK